MDVIKGKKIIDCMKLVVKWRDMYEFCISRSNCIDCPQNEKGICRKETTANVMSHCANTFKEYIKELEE